MDFTAVNLALIAISEDAQTDLDTIQWLLSGYILMLSAFVLPGGHLSDIYGKRCIFLWGAIIFSVSSLIIGATNHIGVIIFGRFLQGIGSALIIPNLYALTFISFPREKQGMAIGIVSGAAGLGLALGPSIGAFMVRSLWRLPIGVGYFSSISPYRQWCRG